MQKRERNIRKRDIAGVVGTVQRKLNDNKQLEGKIFGKQHKGL